MNTIISYIIMVGVSGAIIVGLLFWAYVLYCFVKMVPVVVGVAVRMVRRR